MDTQKFNVRELFERGIQYVIPRYQRHYIWNKEDQWRPLWEDIESMAAGMQGRESSQHVRPSHFTGAIVTQGRLAALGAPPVWEVIDGQQRLITFQIVLCAIRDVCRDLKPGQFSEIADDIERYTKNPGMHATGDAKFKLLPSRPDRSAFKSLVESGGGDGVIKDAYNFFKKESEKFIAEDTSKAKALLAAVTEGFNIVQIAVEDRDEPETIFQSLNGKGQRLWQFDLLRNDLFLRMRQTAPDEKDGLYERYWEPFESPEWGENVGVGRQTVPLSELFLQNFLAAKSMKATGSSYFHHYRKYRKYPSPELNTAGTIESELKELRKCAEHYTRIVDDEEPEGEMAVYNILDTTTLRPFILYILSDSELSEKQYKYIFRALESYAVRRALCEKYPIAHFNVFFAGIIRYLRGLDQPLLHTPVTALSVLKELKSSTSHTDRWPSDKDKEFQHSLSGGWSGQNPAKENRLARYILHKIELFMRDANKFNQGGTPPLCNDMTLEHVLPRKWRQYWTLPSQHGPVKWEDIFSDQYKKENSDWSETFPEEGQEEHALKDSTYTNALDTAKARDRLLNSFGNLTLVTHNFNSHLKNHPFLNKKRALDEHALLMLHKDICDKQDWDIEQIQERENRMCEIFLKIWPDAQWFLDNIPKE